MWSGNFIFAGYCVLNSRSEAVEETSYFGSIYLQKMNRTQRSVGSVDSEHIGQQYCSWSSSYLAKDILRTNIYFHLFLLGKRAPVQSCPPETGLFLKHIPWNQWKFVLIWISGVPSYRISTPASLGCNVIKGLPVVSFLAKSCGPYIMMLLVSKGVFITLWVELLTNSKFFVAPGYAFSSMFSKLMVTKWSRSGLICSCTAPGFFHSY